MKSTKRSSNPSTKDVVGAKRGIAVIKSSPARFLPNFAWFLLSKPSCQLCITEEKEGGERGIVVWELCGYHGPDLQGPRYPI
jgi:hypothetical protein